MSQLTDVIKDVHNALELKTKRGEDCIVKGIVDSAAAKIHTVATWDSSSAVAWESAIDAASFSPELTKILRDAGDQRTSSYTENKSPQKAASGAPPRDQSLKSIYNYLTIKDYQVLDDLKSTPAMRDQVVASRLDRLGIRRAGEDNLIKWAVTLIMDCEFRLAGTWPSYSSIYHRVVSFKTLLQRLSPYMGPYIDKYPENPQDLIKSIFEAAYDSADPPIQRYIPRFESLAQHVPLRRSSKLLQRECAPEDNLHSLLSRAISHRDSALHQRSGSGYCNDNSSWSEHRSLRGSWGQVVHHQQEPEAHIPQQVSSSQLNEFKPKTLALVKTEKDDVEAAEADVTIKMEQSDKTGKAMPVDSGAKDDKRKASEDIEEAAYQALVLKSSKAKAKASAKAKAKAKIAKVAAEAPLETSKKPACVMKKRLLRKPAANKPTTVMKASACPIVRPLMTYNPKFLPAEKGLSRNTFASKHYHRVRRMIMKDAKMNAASREEKFATTSYVLKVAGRVWEKNQ